MKAEIILLNLSCPGQRLPSLASGVLRCWALADEILKASVAIYFCEATMDEAPEVVAARIAARRPLLVGFSCYVWNINATFAVMRELKRLLPSAQVLLGGPEASGLASEILESNWEIDYVATGEGEETFRLLLRALFTGDGGIADIPGLARRDKGRIIIAPDPPLIDLASSSSSYLGGHVFIPPDPTFIIMETSRGCPFACSYCDWGPRTMRYIDLQRIAKEFEFGLRHASSIVMNDADILLESRRALAIMAEFLRAARGYSTATLTIEANPVHLRPEIVDFIAQAPNSFFLALGLQSISPEVHRLMKRPFNLGAIEARMDYFGKRCPDAKIYFSLIYGLPGDDLRGFEQTLEWALRYRPVGLGLNQCLALPGSELSEKARDFGLKVQNEAPHRVLSTPTMTAGDISEARRLSALIIFVMRLPPLRERLLGPNSIRLAGRILPFLKRWKKSVLESGVVIERQSSFDDTPTFPLEMGTSDAAWFLREPLELAALLKATDKFAEKEEAEHK